MRAATVSKSKPVVRRVPVFETKERARDTRNFGEKFSAADLTLTSDASPALYAAARAQNTSS